MAKKVEDAAEETVERIDPETGERHGTRITGPRWAMHRSKKTQAAPSGGLCMNS